MRHVFVALVVILAGVGSASAEQPFHCELYPAACEPPPARVERDLPPIDDYEGMFAGSDDTEQRLEDLERRQRQLEIEAQFPYRRPGTRFD